MQSSTWLRPNVELYELWMGFRVVPGVPLGAWNPVPELIEEVRDLFIMESSISEVVPLFRVPGLEQQRKILHVETWHIDFKYVLICQR